MKQEEIIENNKLIAEFMGIEERDMVFLFPVNLGKLFYSPNSCYNSKDEDCFELELAGLNYHNSWDWLMPCIGKISNQCEEPEELDNLKYALLTNNIEEAYRFVINYLNK